MQQCERVCVAVRAVVCDSVVRQCAAQCMRHCPAVRAAVCGSASGRVRAAVQAAVCGCVRCSV
jgi:hypothetical protein